MDQSERQTLAAKVLRLLREHPEGLSEYELLRQLPLSEAEDSAGLFRDTTQLFRAHFKLFHTLYFLRQQLWTEQRGHLEIDPMRVLLRPYSSAVMGQELAHQDSLRDYYMDASNIEKTSAEELDEMIGRFWAYVGADERRDEALAVFELEEPVDYETVKRRYRELAMRHHPDRGGDRERLQVINDAMNVLERIYRPGTTSARRNTKK